MVAQEIWFVQTNGFCCLWNIQFSGAMALQPLFDFSDQAVDIWRFAFSLSTPFLFLSDPLPWWKVLSWQPWRNAILRAWVKYNGDTSKSRLSLPLPLWLGSLGEEPLLKVKYLVKHPYLLSPKGFFLLRLPVRTSTWQSLGFWFCFLFSCEVKTYSLGIELGNAYFYADYQRVVD